MNRWSEIRSSQCLHTFKPSPAFLCRTPTSADVPESQTSRKTSRSLHPSSDHRTNRELHSSLVSRKLFRPYWINRPEPSPFTLLASISLGCPDISSLALRDWHYFTIIGRFSRRVEQTGLRKASDSVRTPHNNRPIG